MHLRPVLPTVCSCCHHCFCLCRGEFQVSPSPVPPGYPRAPCVPLHHPSAARRPHVSVLHLCDVLSDCCFAAGKPQPLIQKEPLRYCEKTPVSRLNRSQTSSSGPHFQSLPTKHHVSSVDRVILPPNCQGHPHEHDHH